MSSSLTKIMFNRGLSSAVISTGEADNILGKQIAIDLIAYAERKGENIPLPQSTINFCIGHSVIIYTLYP